MKQFKRGLAFLLAFVMVIGSLSFGGVDAQAASKKKATVKSVTITKPDTKTLVLKKGQSFTAKVKVVTTGKASKAVTWKSSKKSVATVSSKGKIKAKKNGTTKITVTSKANKKKKATLTVKVKTPVTKVTLDKKAVTLTEGETAKIKATVTPAKATIKKIAFSSSDEKVAKVNKNGVITAVKEGKATITAKSQDGNAKKATCSVTVTKKAAPAPATPAPTVAPTAVPTAKPTAEPTAEPTPEVISYEDYDAEPVWVEEFEGKSLSENTWNIEVHDPGYVNDELQSYVVSENNIKVEGGKLHLKAIKTETVSANGIDKIASYTSGRVNTMGNKEFKYGLFECVAKVPEGQGFLPAFWMMPANENLYGQWPRCGEIDAMEVMGQETDKVYGTIHYGNPHSESQGTQKLKGDSFSAGYHKFSCEWEPGKIKWYVDGVKYHEESFWYSTTVGKGTVAYPAPFDQPFYIILNLAVGGSWVGNPNESTSFDNAEFVVDSVKVWQKDAEYYEKMEKNAVRPERPFNPKQPNADGNYINNGDFSVAESLTDDVDWKFMTAKEGEATAKIAGNKITINTTKAGTDDYSVQLVQAKVPFEKGAKYEVQFTAKAASARTMNCAIKAPDRGYTAYYSKNINLTTEEQIFTDTFVMKEDSDDNGRLEYNMGATSSTASIEISKVSIKKVKDADPNAEEEKTIRSDGNSVYNGEFQEGKGYMAYWTVINNCDAETSVTNLKDGRRFKAVVTKEDAKLADLTLSQNNLPVASGKKYQLSFEAESDAAKTIQVKLGDRTYSFDLTKGSNKYTQKLTTGAEETKTFIAFLLGKGTTYIDNVRLEEDALIKNGKFDAGLASWESNNLVFSPAAAEFTVDSLTEDNAFDISISSVGTADWNIQLQQKNVAVENGKYYKLGFDIKSDLNRNISYAILEDGGNWTNYVNDTISVGSEYQSVVNKFQMTHDTDLKSVFKINMGKIDEAITKKHRICIDNVYLEEITQEEYDAYVKEQTIKNHIASVKNNKNAKVLSDLDAVINEGETTASGTTDTTDKANGTYLFNITNEPQADKDYGIQLTRGNVSLVKGNKYELRLLIESSEARKVSFGFQNEGYTNYDADTVSIKAGELKLISFKYTMVNPNDTTARVFVSFGDNTVTKASTVKIYGVALVEKEQEELVPYNKNMLPDTISLEGDNKWDKSTVDGGSVTVDNDGKVVFTNPALTAGDPWNVELKKMPLTLENNESYEIAFDIESSIPRNVTVKLQHNGDASDDTWNSDPTRIWSAPVEKSCSIVSANTVQHYKEVVKVTTPDMLDDANANMLFAIDMGYHKTNLEAHTIKISNISLKKVEATSSDPDPDEPQEGNLFAGGTWGLDCGAEGTSYATADQPDANGVITYTFTSELPSSAKEWWTRITKDNLKLIKGKKYRLSFKITSTAARTIKSGFMYKDAPYTWYGGGETKELAADTETTVTYDFTVGENTSDNIRFYLNLGAIGPDDSAKVPSGTATYTISDLSLTRVDS